MQLDAWRLGDVCRQQHLAEGIEHSVRQCHRVTHSADECHSVYVNVLCTNCPLLALQRYWLQEAQHRLSKGCNESGSDTFPSRGNPLA